MDFSETLNTGANAERVKMQLEQDAVKPVEQLQDDAPEYMKALEKINSGNGEQ